MLYFRNDAVTYRALKAAWRLVQSFNTAASTDASQTVAESLKRTLNKALAFSGPYSLYWQKLLNCVNQLSASSAVVPRNGGGFKLSVSLSE